MNINTLCFSSGGIQGLSFLGAIKCLEINNYIDLNNIHTFVGCSIGSVIGFLLSLKYTINELILFIKSYNFNEIEPDFDFDNILNNNGFDNGVKITNLLLFLLENKLNKKDITFEELYKITNNKLIIIGTNFTKQTKKIFSYETTPNISILTAVRISISIPLIFTPVLFEDDYYVDGCLIDNFPLNLCDIDTTLGFYISNNQSDFELNSLLNLIMGTISILINNNEKNIDKYKYIKINKYDNNIFNLNIDIKNVKKLINNGYKYARKYLKSVYIKNIEEQKKENINKLIIKKTLDDIIDNILNKYS